MAKKNLSISLSDSPCTSLHSSNLNNAVFSINDFQNFVKSKTNSFLNSLLYGKWRRKIIVKKFNSSANKSILWLLGKAYILEEFNNETSNKSFLIDFRSRIWFSYREGFAPLLNINQNNAKSDCGWGCMLRCAQMMFANAILILNLSRDWVLDNKCCNLYLFNIIKLFEDCTEAPLGIHRLLQIALERQLTNQNINDKNSNIIQDLALKLIGKWFTPSEAILLLREAVNYFTIKPLIIIPKIYLSIDNNVFIEELEILSDNWRHPIIFIVCVRLGTKQVNKIYYNQIKNLFSIKQCCGAIGGLTKKAFYFIGNCQDNLYYLDPHTVQKYQPLLNNIKYNETMFNDEFCDCEMLKWKSFHNLKTSSIQISEMNPSIAIGFLCKTKNELNSCIFDLALAKIIEFKSTKNNNEELSTNVITPLFSVFEKRISQKVYDFNNEPTNSVNEDGFEIF